MFTIKLHDEQLQLISPDVDRDARLGVAWLAGAAGRETLRLMGVADKDNQPSTFRQEEDRIRNFLDRKDQLNWMIEYDGRVVGAVWVELEPTDHLRAPAIHIMLGDVHARGKGIGLRTMKLVLDYLGEQGYKIQYSRYLVQNKASAAMLTRLGFEPDGAMYQDEDGLTWQNIVRKIEL